jgi:hydroxymethylglutaryl-CoA reductase (NADPH)
VPATQIAGSAPNERVNRAGRKVEPMSSPPLLGRLYTMGSLVTDDHGFQFGVKNRLFAATLVGVDGLVMDGIEVSLAEVTLVSDGVSVPADDLGVGIAFPLRAEVLVRVAGPRLAEGQHELEVSFRAEPFGEPGVRGSRRRGGRQPDASRPAPRSR